MMTCQTRNLGSTVCFAAAVFCLAVLTSTNAANGQGDIGVPPVGNPQQPIDQFPNNGGVNSGGAQVGESGEGVDLEGAASLDFGGPTEDSRNQGFIGATADIVSAQNFVGSASQTFGELAEDATFGGGVNDQANFAIPGGGGTAGGRTGFGGAGGFGGFGGQTSGNIIRGNLRTRLVQAFAAPQIPPQVTTSRFYDNFARQPTSQNFAGQFQIAVRDKTAVITGFATQAEAKRVERQLRLQPGIYKIVNQLQITQ